MVELEINGVRFSYGSKEILHGVEFSVHNGEVVGILGQNGSGKTTLLNCINTEYRPGGGNVCVVDFSRDVLIKNPERTRMDVREFSEPERSRVIATVEQNSGSVFPFTVMETVRMGRYSRTGAFDEGSEDESQKVVEFMELAGVLEFADRSVSELSGGEWRRVMIAQALAQEPDILLLDEPTLHLDINHQFDLMELCRDIVRSKDILIVIVTHDLQLAARYCDRLVVMKKGEVVAVGTAREVVTEEMIRDVFHMRARVGWDDEINGMSVFLIGKAD